MVEIRDEKVESADPIMTAGEVFDEDTAKNGENKVEAANFMSKVGVVLDLVNAGGVLLRKMKLNRCLRIC